MTRPRRMLLAPFFIALFGALFAGWNSWNFGDTGSAACFTAGCTLYQQFTIAGFSLWWGGVGAFLLLALLALLGFDGLGRLFSGIGLGLDCLLLIIMALTIPCVSCMVAAILLALCYWRFRAETLLTRRIHRMPARSWLLTVWALLFVVNLGLVCRSGLDPWPLRVPDNNEPAAVSVFFSPSCGACRELVKGMQPDQARKVAWYPVAEDSRDFAVILALGNALLASDKPLSALLEDAMLTPEPSRYDLLKPKALLLQFRLWRNHARVLEAGQGRLPFVEFHGLPVALLRQPARPSSAPAGRTPGADATLPIDLGLAGSCGQNSDCP